MSRPSVPTPAPSAAPSVAFAPDASGGPSGATRDAEWPRLLVEAVDGVPFVWELAPGAVDRPGDAADAPDAGWWRDRIHPDDLVGPVAAGRAALDDPAARRVVVEYRVRGADGAWRWVCDRARLVRDATGRVVRVVGISTDVTAERERQEALAREHTERLQRLSADLTRVLTRGEVTEVVVRHLVAALGAHSGGVVELTEDGREFVLLGTVGFRDEVRRDYGRYSVDTPVPVRDVARTRAAVFLGSRAEWVARFERPPVVPEGDADGAWAALPLRVDDRLVGALTVSLRGAREFGDRERRFMQAFADLCAQALERARLYEAEHTARARAELLQRVTARLARVQTMADVGRVFSRGLTTLLGADTAWVGVVTPDGSAVEALGWAGYAEDAAAQWTRLPLDAPIALSDAVRTARPQWWTAREALVAAYPTRAAVIRAAAQESLAILPLVAEGGAEEGASGGIVVGFRAAQRFDADTRAFFLALAQQCAQAIARARAYEAEREARRQADAARVRAERLHALTAALARAVTAEAVVEAAVVEGGRSVGSMSGSLALLDDDGRAFTLVPGPGLPADVAAAWRRFPNSGRSSAAEAVRTLRPSYSRTRAEFAGRSEALAALAERLQLGANAALPLVVSDGGSRPRVLGVLAFVFAEPRAFGAEDDAFLRAVADQCAQALERSRLYEAERRARAAAERARAEAEAANRAKSEFLAVMSHELRTPLNAIAGYAELLELGIHGAVTEAQLGALGRIQRSQKHLLALINEVLNYARLEAGAVRYTLEPVGVCAALAAVESFVLPQVRAKGLRLAVDACDRALAVRADAEKLSQVLLNLLSNAVKFTDAGGEIAVRCRAAAPGADGAPRVAVEVADTGIGIASDQLERIFEPFVQVGRTLSSPGDGAGLGLAISRDLARGMGGDLAAASVAGEGSTFTLTLLRA